MTEAELVPVVKADAYGHGAGEIAPYLSREGAHWFAVSNLEEAIALRPNVPDAGILILGYTPVTSVSDLAKYRITQAVLNQEYGEELSRQALLQQVKVDVHIKIDSGMNRIGLPVDVKEAEKIFALEGLHVTGIFTHFCTADGLSDFENRYYQKQWNAFISVVNSLRKKGYDTGFCHCSNSATILRTPDYHLSGVRPGIILYGCDPSDEVYDHQTLRPIMELHSVVSMIKRVPAGTRIGYGATEATQKDSNIATIPIGYADGYPRALSNGKGHVLIGGKRYPIIGRICMDQLMVNMGDDTADTDDDVVLIGSMGDERITAEEIAKDCNTIPYEILCGISKRVPRVYLLNGEVQKIVDLIL